MLTRPAARRPPPAARIGFTLAELVVALVLLASGALVLVAASAAGVQTVASGDAQVAAAMAARNRIERLAAGACSRLSEGGAADSANGLREWWTVSVGRNGARLVSDSVEYVDRESRRLVVLHRFAVC